MMEVSVQRAYSHEIHSDRGDLQHTTFTGAHFIAIPPETLVVIAAPIDVGDPVTLVNSCGA
jgi:hypothetical protein